MPPESIVRAVCLETWVDANKIVALQNNLACSHAGSGEHRQGSFSLCMKTVFPEIVNSMQRAWDSLLGEFLSSQVLKIGLSHMRSEDTKPTSTIAMPFRNGAVVESRKNAKRNASAVEDEARRKFRQNRSERLQHIFDYIHLISPIGLVICFACKCLYSR